jgi:hypothetical protein
MAQQILANTNVMLKQQLVKIPDFWGEKSKDTITATQFMARIDECQVPSDWNDRTTYANFSLCLRGEADKWLPYVSPSRLNSSSEDMDTHSTTVQKRIRRRLRQQAYR